LILNWVNLTLLDYQVRGLQGCSDTP
jgi:hypothetical protein